MLVFAVILVAVSILFLLTTLALTATDSLQHPLRVACALIGMLLLGLLLLLE